MKITFICGCLETGKDGVGDYVRRLAFSLIKHGHFVTAVSLNDQFIDQILEEKSGDDEKFEMLRMPSTMDLKKRLAFAKTWIDKFDPDWISLQFVIFSYHPKGLPWRLGEDLSLLGEGRKWHIMFHEIWVGLNKEAPAKYLFWGYVQKILIKKLVRKLKPKVVNTHSELYLVSLRRLGISTKHLPLFSNIPVLYSKKYPSGPTDIQLIVFGSVHPYSNVEKFVSELSCFQTKYAKTVQTKLVGRNGKEQERWSDLFKLNNLQLEILGERSEEQISEILANSSAGVSTSALPMIEKSGTVAAMLEHGLPVICISKKWNPKQKYKSTIPYGVYEFKEGFLEDFLLKIPEIKSDGGLNKISQVFIESLAGDQVLSNDLIV